MFAGSNLDNLRATGPHLSADDARALIARVGLPHDLLKCDADTLSGGEAQRLCLARALAARPQAILAGIIVFAAVTITRRAPHVPVLRWVTLLANVLVAVSALAINFGIVFLPGAMTGLILAGADPLEAVRTQLALMYVILAGVAIAAVITGLGRLRRLTTDQQTLLRLARK